MATLSIFFCGRGDGSFVTRMTFSTGTSHLSVAVERFYSDHQMDIVITPVQDSSVNVHLGEMKQVYVKHMTLSMKNESQRRDLVIRHFNDDDKTNIAVANSGTINVAIFLKHGND